MGNVVLGRPECSDVLGGKKQTLIFFATLPRSSSLVVAKPIMPKFLQRDC